MSDQRMDEEIHKKKILLKFLIPLISYYAGMHLKLRYRDFNLFLKNLKQRMDGWTDIS